MHKLSRHVLRPQHLTRLARASRPVNALSPIIPRSYATSSSNNGTNNNSNNPPRHPVKAKAQAQEPSQLASSSTSLSTSTSSTVGTRPSGLFDRLLAALKPGLQEDELAMIIASMINSTKNLAKLEVMEDKLQSCLLGLDRAKVQKLVNHYMQNPPTAAFIKSLESEVRKSAEVSKNSTKPTQKKGDAAEASESQLSQFPSELPTGSPMEELLSQLQLPSSRQVLELLEPAESEQLRTLMSQIVHQATGGEDAKALLAVKDFLATRGINIRYTTRPKPIVQTQRIDFLKELRALRNDEGQEEVSEAQGVEDTPSSGLGMDPVAFAKRASEDKSLVSVQEAPAAPSEQIPNLMTPDPLIDSRDEIQFRPTKTNPYLNKVTIRNHSSIFHEALAAKGFDFASEDWKPTTTDETEEQLTSTDNLPLTPAELRKLYRFPIFTRRITQQTGKGKIHRQFVLMIVGNGDGLVGLGQGKDTDHARAESKAFAEAVRNMDWVERFEKRTIWTEMEAKLGATRLIMRPRPVGFGLRCNPGLHQVLKAAGIKDVSAKVWGSRNKINVIKAAMRMLQAGHAPLAMGDGVGGPGRKLNKGNGLRSQWDVERERGRRMVSLRK